MVCYRMSIFRYNFILVPGDNEADFPFCLVDRERDVWGGEVSYLRAKSTSSPVDSCVTMS